MFLLDWYKEFLRIREDYESRIVCQNCEYLKTQLEIEQQFNKVLFEKLTTEPKTEPVPVERQEPLKPRFTPWRVRRQMLENEDRRAAQVLRAKQEELAHKPTIGPNTVDGVEIAPADDPDVIALEKELGIVEQERNNASRIR